jgi:hypothetical protein
VASVPNLLVVSPALGPKSVKELVAYAKARPGQINFSSAGIGSGTQINGEMFRLAAGFEATHVPYKGAVESLNDAMTGRVQFTFSPVLVSQGLVKAGKVLALAVSTAKRSRCFGLPTVAEAGSRADYDQWRAWRLQQAALVNQPFRGVVRILNLPDIRERMLTRGRRRATTPEEFDALSAPGGGSRNVDRGRREDQLDVSQGSRMSDYRKTRRDFIKQGGGGAAAMAGPTKPSRRTPLPGGPRRRASRPRPQHAQQHRRAGGLRPGHHRGARCR